MEQRFNVFIVLHNGNSSKLTYAGTKEHVEDIVWKIWYEGFLETNPANPKRKIHILPDQIKSIQIKPVED